jgi:epoxyqueuosine reductase
MHQIVKQSARDIGFDLVGIAPAGTPETLDKLEEWLSAGYSGEMDYLEKRREAYSNPDHVLSGVRSIVVVALNYRSTDPVSAHGEHEARVSRYAWGSQDYHTVMRHKLRQLANALHGLSPGCRTRCVVDTAPLLERDLARVAGLGWFGKNTMLINKRIGSWFFLGAVLTDIELQADAPHETAHCGTCTRCLDACPTDAFVQPYVLDASKCISYLTIELRERPIPEEQRPGLGDWLFGCDVCQEVCPWNRKAPRSVEAVFQPRADLAPADCIALLGLSASEFDARYGATPLERPGRGGILRNACIVLGNARCRDAVGALERACADDDVVVRDAAEWALAQISAAQPAETCGGWIDTTKGRRVDS